MVDLILHSEIDYKKGNIFINQESKAQTVQVTSSTTEQNSA